MKTFALFGIETPHKVLGSAKVFITVVRAEDLRMAATRLGGTIRRPTKGPGDHSDFFLGSVGVFTPGETTKHVLPDKRYAHASALAYGCGLWLGEVNVVE